ncbi:M14 family metallopeptidase [Aquibacillus sp. 3ASR75-11]|uniref:M14 family metallopeptidase n=1 Tax=Terrihalobacillus insolitus TaxID=2950438 RepID=A0A9X3WUK1_9BACI|nr:M14 family metallopeptidase [Terrihalobacillus insolitus]MDC3413792.1 M14 family metallopeptidase [Terrihalobacillus insolitus]MDC3425960.1 M14 family metallopeptidase [Terrihalobacillus insolitus]
MLKTTTRKYEEIFVTHLSNGSEVSLPVHTITGERSGPVLGLSAVVHGDEIIGSEILRRVYDRLDEAELAGSVKIMPVANPLAFESMTRNTPLDMNNMNRIFPGSAGGWVTEQISHKIATEFLDTIDAYIDIHSGGAQPVVDYVYIQNDEELSRAFNFPVLYRPKTLYEGTTVTYTVEKDIPSVTVEVGGGPNFEKDIERGVEGIFNCMRKLNMLDGEVTPPPEQKVMTEIQIIRPKQGGLMIPEYDYSAVGTVIEGNQVLSRTYNPRTFEEVEVIKAPFEKNLVILMRGSFQKVNPGDYGFMLGNMDTRELD